MRNDVESTMDIHLSCSKAHIPMVAAEQLFRTLICYLQPDGLTASPAMSILNYPPVHEPRKLPWERSLVLPAPALVHHAFERRASEMQERPAIDFLTTNHGRISATYAEVNVQADRLAESITKILRSIRWPAVRGQQRVIPIFMSACPELYITVLAILKAGHAFCPLPIDSPEERIYDILYDLEAPAMLGVGTDRFACAASSSQRFRRLADKLWLDVLNAENWPELSEACERPEAYSPATVQGTDSLAYVYYTSGSTGKPKGVQISHLAATCAISANAEAMPEISSRENLRWFQLAVPTFDAFILDVFFTFSAGGTLCMAERDLTLTNLEGTINATGANVTHTVPSLAMTLRPERLTTLQTLVCIGEKISRKVVEEFSSHSSNSLINLYGPTEATINVTIQDFTPHTRGTIIGKPLSTSSIILIDDTTYQAVPAGLPGHLAIGGPQLSHGYLNRPVENAKQFITTKDFGQLYLTGDKARIVWTEQGEQVLECLGRIQDGQVKLNGRRVELEEIDSVLSKATCVKEVATVTIEMAAGTQLYACIVPAANYSARMIENDCRKIAASNLPGWMHPHHYFLYPSLARNVSGKIDRGSLRKSVQGMLAARTSRVGASLESSTMQRSCINKPVGETEDKDLTLVLCDLLKQCLIHAEYDIQPSTSLFAIGFDSLRSIAFLQKARDIGIHELGIQDMLKGLSPKELAKAVVTRRQAARRKLEKGQKIPCGAVDQVESDGAAKLRKLFSDFEQRFLFQCSRQLKVPVNHIESILPATYTQTRMIANFLSAEARSAPKPWVEHFVYDVPEVLDSHRFQEAVFAVLSRHPCHRTIFTLTEDPTRPAAQIVLIPTCSEATIPWSNRLCTERDRSGNDTLEHMIKEAQQAADQQMCLERPPLAVSFLRSSGSTRCVFILSMFHGLYDGASLKLLRQEIMMEYHEQLAPVRESITTSSEIHFGADQQGTLKFWIAKLAVTPYYKLAGVPGVDLRDSTTQSNSESTGHSTVSVITKRSRVLFAELVECAKSVLLTTPLAVIQAAWALVLLECQQTMDPSRPRDEPSSYDVTFGSTIHGRHDQRSELCMGPILATVPVCIAGDTSDDTAETNRDMCAILANEHAEALENLQIPCPSLEFAQSSTRFDTTLILQTFGEDEPNQAVDFPGFEEGDNWLPAYRGSDFCMPVLNEIMPGKGGIMDFRCTYMVKSLDYPWLNKATVSRLMDMFEGNLLWIMACPDEVFDYRNRGPVL